MKNIFNAIIKQIPLETLLIKIFHVVVEEIKDALTKHQDTIKK